MNDRYLGHLIPREDDDPPIPLDVTLNVGGTLVSGELITEDEYFERLASWLENDAVPGSRERLEAFADEQSRLLKEAGEVMTPDEEAALREEAVNAGLRTASDRLVRSYNRAGDEGKFIHLRNAEIRIGGGSGARSPLWRGSLDAVEGFTMGTPKQD